MRSPAFHRWLALFALILLAPSSFASAVYLPTPATTYALTVVPGATFYCCSDLVSLNGSVTPAPASGTSVTLSVYNPTKTLVRTAAPPLDAAGDYNYSFSAGGTNWVTGLYSVNATWSPSVTGTVYHASALFNYSATAPPPFSFTMSLSSSSGSVQQGSSVNSTVVLGLSAGITEPVTFSASGLPSGATAAFSNPSCSPSCTSTMTISTTQTTAAGTYSVTVSGTASTASEQVTYALTVTTIPVRFDVSLTPKTGSVIPGKSVSTGVTVTQTSGNPTSVSFAVSALPSGASASFSPSSCTITCSSTLTITTTSAIVPGSYTLTVSATGDGVTNSSTYDLSVTAFKFDISLSPSSGSVKPGQSTTSTVTLTLTSGAPPTLTFSASGLPTGATAAFNPTSCAPTCSSTLTIALSASVAPGTYTVTVTASGGGAVNSTTYTLTVIPFRFDIAVAPPSGTLTQGQSLKATVTLTLTSGTPVAATFSVSGLPSGATASFSPASCTPTCSSTMTITASTTAATGTFTVTVKAAGGTGSNSTTFALTLVPYRFDVSATPSSGSVKPGQSATTAVALVLKSGTAVPVTFSASGLPSGATAAFSPTSCSPSCSSTLTVSTATTTPPGVYSLTVTAAGGGFSNSTKYTLTVTPFKFDISAAPPALSVVQGFTNTTQITLTLISGTAVAVAFAASGLPTGVTPSFSPASCTPSCSTVLTLTASKGVVPGTYSFAVAASGGGGTNSTALRLTVIAAKYLVTFTESGLQTGATWSVTLNGVTNSSTGAAVTFLEVNGVYSFTASAEGYFVTPSSGTVTVNEAPAGVSLAFAPLKYLVTFSETGLASGTLWSVDLNGTTASSTAASLAFNEVNGTYQFTVPHVSGYVVSPTSGSVTVAGANATVPLTFTRVYAVVFDETGLPSGTSWTVALGTGSNASTTSKVTFREPNGEYFYNATSPGYGPVTGYVFVYNGAATVAVAFVKYYPVTFTETGLASGQTWGVQTSYGFESTTGTSIVISAASGAYDVFSVEVGPTYSASPASGSVFVNGPQTVNVTFTPTYVVLFTQSTLPSGQYWYVYLNGQFNSSVGGSIEFRVPSGTYPYYVYSDNSSFVPSPASGSVTVSGSNPSPVSIAFIQQYAVTFSETGLAPYTCWESTLTEGGANVTQYSYSTTSQFYVPTGTYSFYAGSCEPLASSVTPASGTITVTSAGVSQALSFSTSYFAVQLKDQNGKAAPDLLVTFTVNGEYFDSSFTNSTGWTMPFDVATGLTVTVNVQTSGTIYQPFAPANFSTTAGNDFQTIALQTLQVGYVSGRVTYTNGTAVGSAIVAAGVVSSTNALDSLGSFETQTNSTGYYALTLPAGNVTLVVSSPDNTFNQASANFALSALQNLTENFAVVPLLNGYIHVNLYTQYVGGQLEGPLPIDWRVAVHFDLYAQSSTGAIFGPYANWVNNSLPVVAEPGEAFTVCITGTEANLPNECVSTVTNSTVGATVTLKLIQPGVISGTVVDVATDSLVTSGWTAAMYFYNSTSGLSTFVGSISNSSSAFYFSVPEPGEYLAYLTSGTLTGTVTTTVASGELDSVGNMSVYPAGLFTDRPGNSLVASPTVTTVGSEVQMRGSYAYSGTSTLTNAELLIQVPGGTSLDTASILLNGASASSTLSGGDYAVQLGSLAPGASGVLRYTLTVTSAIGNGTSFRPILFINYTLSGATTQELVGATTVTVVHISIVAPSQVETTTVPVSGQGPPGSALQIYDGNSSVGSLTVPQGGYWSASVTLVASGDPSNHTLYAVAKLASGVTERSGNAMVLYDTYIPALVSWSMQQTDGRLVEFNASQGVVLFPYVVVPCMPITVTLNITNPAYAFGVNVTITGAGSAIATLGSDGLYTATLDYCSYGGLGAIYVTFNGQTTEVANPTWVYDPSGYVYEAVTSNRLEGVTATIYQLVGGSWVPWDAAAYAQQNNELTNALGQYGWYVPEGYWKVVFTLPGYVTAQTEILDVPPPATGLNIGMVSLAPPTVTGVSAVNINGSSYVQVQFSRYVRFSSAASIFVELGGSNVTGTVVPVDLQLAPTGEHLATEFRFVPSSPLVAGETYGVLVGKTVESYANVTMVSTYTTSAKVLGSLQYSGETSAPGGTITLGESLAANATTTDPLASVATFSWVNPAGETVSTAQAAVSAGFAASPAFTPDVNGTWSVEIGFGTSTSTFKTVSVPFQVVPGASAPQADGSTVALLSEGTGSGGSFVADSAAINGIVVSVTGTSPSVTASVDSYLYSSLYLPGLPAVPYGGSSLLYFDVKISNVNTGTAAICDTDAALAGHLSSTSEMYYYDSSTGAWAAAANVTVTLATDTICGDVPVAALTGTQILVAQPASSGGSGTSPATGQVTFAESGLPTGTLWSATLNGTTQSSTTSQIVFSNLPLGTASWTVAAVPVYSGAQYAPASSSGTVDVTGIGTVSVSFSEQYLVTMAVTPAGSGSTAPSGSVWVPAGSAISIQATPASGFGFSEWSATSNITVATPSSPSTSATVAGPGTVTAGFYAVSTTTTTTTTITTRTSQTASATTTTSTSATQQRSTTPTSSSSSSASPPPPATNWLIIGGVAVAFVLIAIATLIVRRRAK
ncbi:MAG: hypothetical protein JRN21_05235 [Nitrososphaerota archaeon]|nr:hypothetical protein [Nitrososphaerota archaeon]